MINFDITGVRFNYRVAGVCIEDRHVLLCQFEDQGFWFLPGGRCEISEASIQSLEREMHEELGVRARAGSLLWVLENFFEANGVQYHELGLYFSATLPQGSDILDPGIDWRRPELDGTVLHFRWFPIKDLEQINLQPAVLRTELQRPPSSTRHIVSREG